MTETKPGMEFIDLQAQRARLGPGVDGAIQGVLDHGRFIMGPEVAALEEELARRAGVASAVTCGSGTEALLMLLMAWGIGPGDAVFVPSFTFAATAEVVSLLGGTPVFVDVDRDTFNMDPASLSAAVRDLDGLVGRAIIAVDLFGLPADYEQIVDIASKAGLKVLADAAQSFGGSVDDRPVGSFGDATATSFFPAKPLGCYGDGGAVLTDDEDLAQTLRSIRVHGQGTDKYDNVRIGINGRLDTIQAAILLQKLTVFDEEIALRQRVAGLYNAGFADLEGVGTQAVPSGAISAWAQFTLTVPNREATQKHLSERGIPTAVYYPRPLHDQPAYAGAPCTPTGLAISEWLSRRVLSIPMHPYLENSDQTRVIDAIRESR